MYESLLPIVHYGVLCGLLAISSANLAVFLSALGRLRELRSSVNSTLKFARNRAQLPPRLYSTDDLLRSFAATRPSTARRAIRRTLADTLGHTLEWLDNAGPVAILMGTLGAVLGLSGVI